MKRQDKTKLNVIFTLVQHAFTQHIAKQDPILKGLREEDAYPADPDNFYGWEKLYTEKMCEAYQRDYKMDIRMLRYHNIYGPEGTYKGGREKSPAAICRKVVEASKSWKNCNLGRRKTNPIILLCR